MPTATRAGGIIRSQRLTRALSQRASVTVIVLDAVDDHEAVTSLTGASAIESYPSPYSASHKRWLAVRHGWPIPSARLWSPAAADRIRQLSISGSTVLLDHLATAIYAPPPPTQYFLMLHNVESRLVRDVIVRRSAARQLEWIWDVAATASQERRALAESRAHLITVSEVDLLILGGQGDVIPNGADLPSSPSPVPVHGSILFIGSLDHAPNQMAVRWWADRVWPHLRPGLPPLTVVGRGREHLATRLHGHPGVRVIGEAPRVDEYLAQASVVAIPIHHGGGTRLKVLEALAWGRPIVSTTKGIEGLPLTAGQDVLVEDSAERFAAAVSTLWDDGRRAHDLGAAGRLIAERFAWDTIGDLFSDVVCGR